uniref:Neuritin 1 n=1 Tax=Latimeria chalumnae TaxID=7897 RepID=H3BGR9_LATCH
LVCFDVVPVCLVAGLTAEVTCENIYKGFSDCVLKLGENMGNYKEEGDETQQLQIVCGYWEEFHICATTAISECQEEASRIWETLKKESKKIKFQGSLFDLCSSNKSYNLNSAQLSNFSLLMASAVLTWFY